MNAVEVSLQSCPALCGLIPSQLSGLAKVCQECRLEPGRQLFAPGEKAEHLFLMVNGHAQMCDYDERGRRAIVRSVWPRDLFGECALAPASERKLACQIARPSHLLAIPVAPLWQLMGINPQLAVDILSLVSNECVRLSQTLVSTMLHSKRRRLIELLNNLSRNQGVRFGRDVTIPIISHQELSEMIGASRETVTTVLGQLRLEGILRYDGRRIIVVDGQITSPEGDE